MNVTRYQPRNPAWGGTSEIRDEMKQFLEHFFGEREAGDPSDVVTSQWAPRVDIKEDTGRFVILADLPGVDPKDIEVHMEKGILSIKGERRAEKKEEKERFVRVERSYGAFHRRFALPDSADADGIRASNRHGVLEISIPKRPESTARRIEVQ